MKKVLFLTLVLVMVMSTSLAFGHTNIGDDTNPADGKVDAEHDVVVTASVSPRLELTIADAGGANVTQYTLALAPAVPANVAVSVTAQSNVMALLDRSAAGGMDLTNTDPTLPYFEMAWAGAAPVAALGSRTHTDNYTVTAGWDVPANVNFVETVTYTLVEQ